MCADQPNTARAALMYEEVRSFRPSLPYIRNPPEECRAWWTKHGLFGPDGPVKE